MEPYSFEKSYAMLDDARQLIPNGIYGPRTPMALTYGSYPCFMDHGKGAHVWDVDGNEYIDYMCSFGTNILGMCHEEIDQAAIEQMKRGDCFTLPSNRWNEMAAYMVGNIKDQDWVVFGKNGSDVTTFATTVARGYTGKKKIILANNAYHGAHYWCLHTNFGIPEEYQEHVLAFDFNNIEQLKTLAVQNSGEIAALILTPYHHPGAADQVMPDPGFYQEVRAICDRENIVYIMDDIRCGFRLNEHGSHCYVGSDPDLICFGKAMANGYPISALTGKEKLKEAAGTAFFTGTHFFSAVPMAASLACMKIIARDGVVEKVNTLGQQLRQGILEQAGTYNMKVSYTGHPAIPFMHFLSDEDYSLNRYFCGEAAKRGVFFHPHHNWFISGAHSEADIKRTLEVTDTCFQLTAAYRERR